MNAWFAIVLAALPLPATCKDTVSELKMRPPAYGEQGRAIYEWDKFLSECEEKMGGTRATFSPEEVDAISKVLNSPPR